MGIRRLLSTMYRHSGGGGRSGLLELREQRQAGRDIREEDAAERSTDQPPRKRPSWRHTYDHRFPPGTRRVGPGGTMVFLRDYRREDGALERCDARYAAWVAGAPDRAIKRLNNVYKLRDIRRGIYEPPVAAVEKEEAT